MKYKFWTVLWTLALLLSMLAVVQGVEEEVGLPPGAESDVIPPPESTTAAEDGVQLPPESGTETEAEPEAESDLVLVGLAYGSSALDGANLENSVGSGYRLGYLDEGRIFRQLGWTGEKAISVVKTQTVCYGTYNDYKSYHDAITTDILVGCWHVLLPTESELTTFEEAAAWAQAAGGFPAWIDGSWQARLGAYGEQATAQAAAEAVGGTVVGTSAYGVSVVKTGTAQILFQFDGGEARSLAVAPGLEEDVKAVTWFRKNRYYGGFQYRRVNGGDLTVSSFLPLEDYLECVLSQEMSRSWPLEALKAQAICASTYYETNLGRHDSYGFDICYTTHCQAYSGMGDTGERTAQAVAETSGLRAWYQGELALTYYFASDGGATEDVRNVWSSSTNAPYLCGVVDPYEETIASKIPFWDAKKTFSASTLASMLQAAGYNCASIVDVQTSLTPTGNVKTLTFLDSNGKSFPFTKGDAKSFLGLQSIHYTVTRAGETAGGAYYTDGGGTLASMSGVYAINGDGSVSKLSGNPYVITGAGTQFLPAPSEGETGETIYTFTSRGYGHNVGMSQWGAYAMAQQGKTFEEIIQFYFPGVEIY